MLAWVCLNLMKLHFVRKWCDWCFFCQSIILLQLNVIKLPLLFAFSCLINHIHGTPTVTSTLLFNIFSPLHSLPPRWRVNFHWNGLVTEQEFFFIIIMKKHLHHLQVNSNCYYFFDMRVNNNCKEPNFLHSSTKEPLRSRTEPEISPRPKCKYPFDYIKEEMFYNCPRQNFMHWKQGK